jgi:hypothetical protein
MKGEVRTGTRHRRLTIFVVAVSAAQALLWSVSSARDFGVLRALLAVAFVGITIVGVIVLVRVRGHQRPL